MAFFKKLKERLFKSSSKIEEGLDAIVEDGGEAEMDVGGVEQKTVADAARIDVEAQLIAAEETAALHSAKIEAQGLAAKAEAKRLAAEKAAQELADTSEAEAKTAQEEMARQAASEVKAERLRVAEATATEQVQFEEAERVSKQAEIAAQLTVQHKAEEERIAAENHISVAEQTEAEKADEDVHQAFEETVEAEPHDLKSGLLGRLFGSKEQKQVVRRALDYAMLESIEDLLITADMGVDTALRVSANLAEGRMGKKLSTGELKGLLSAELARIMEPVAKPMPLYQKRPQVVLVVGVNGSGKTTTIGKLASQFKVAGKSVVIAAGDTFRAAAVEQLQVWGDRAGVPVLTAPEGSDPASLAFDAMTKAEADGADLLMIDTAGRLQNRQDLMEELAKIVRVIRKKDPDAPHNTLLVLDATTGQNALSQVEVFRDISNVSGLVMTKLDGTAKGGVLVALADRFGLPIHAIGVGEQIDDLAPFDPEDFADALTGNEG